MNSKELAAQIPGCLLETITCMVLSWSLTAVMACAWRANRLQNEIFAKYRCLVQLHVYTIIYVSLMIGMNPCRSSSCYSLQLRFFSQLFYFHANLQEQETGISRQRKTGNLIS